MLISFICLVTLCPNNCDRLAVSMTAMSKCAHRGFVVSAAVSFFSEQASLLTHFFTPVFFLICPGCCHVELAFLVNVHVTSVSLRSKVI